MRLREGLNIDFIASGLIGLESDRAGARFRGKTSKALVKPRFEARNGFALRRRFPVRCDRHNRQSDRRAGGSSLIEDEPAIARPIIGVSRRCRRKDLLLIADFVHILAEKVVVVAGKYDDPAVGGPDWVDTLEGDVAVNRLEMPRSTSSNHRSFPPDRSRDTAAKRPFGDSRKGKV
jgi:hypothetical protein